MSKFLVQIGTGSFEGTFMFPVAVFSDMYLAFDYAKRMQRSIKLYYHESMNTTERDIHARNCFKPFCEGLGEHYEQLIYFVVQYFSYPENMFTEITPVPIDPTWREVFE